MSEFEINSNLNLVAIFRRVQLILFAIVMASIGNSLLSLLVPLDFIRVNSSGFMIGLAITVYASGFFIGSYLGPSIISNVGHIRAFGGMAAVISATAISHAFVPVGFLVVMLRFFVGFAMANVFIIFESWLSGASDRSSRGKVLGLYQVFVAFGYGISPWLLNIFDQEDIRLYSLCALFLCLSMVPITYSRRPGPQVSQNKGIYNLKELFVDSPSGFIGALISGLMISPVYNQSIVFFKSIELSALGLSLMLTSITLGGILFQLPMGYLADRIDKRKLIIILLLIGALMCQYILYLYAGSFTLMTIFIVHLILSGSISCVYPLSFNLMFDQIDSERSTEATASLIIVHSVGLMVGPLFVGALMDYGNSSLLFVYNFWVNLIFAAFLVTRVYILKIRIDQENMPYFMNIQNIRPSNLNMYPRFDYYIQQINDPLFNTLVDNIKYSEPKHYKAILENVFNEVRYKPEDIVLNLVLSHPRECDEILKAMLEIFPDKRWDFVYELQDLIVMDKKRINNLMLKGLSIKADSNEKQSLKKYFQKIIDEFERDDSSAISLTPPGGGE